MAPVALRVAALRVPPATKLARVRIESIPDAAEVLLDGKARGKTPLVLELEPSATEHRLELQREGYASVVRKLVADENQRLVISLKAVGSAPRPPKPGSAGKAKPKEGFERFD